MPRRLPPRNAVPAGYGALTECYRLPVSGLHRLVPTARHNVAPVASKRTGSKVRPIPGRAGILREALIYFAFKNRRKQNYNKLKSNQRR